MKTTERLARLLETLSEWIGRTTAWLVLALVCLVAYDVTMRYGFQAGSVALQELEWHLFGIIFLIGAGYTLKHDGHVRVDILYRAAWLSDRQRLWIDVLGSLILLIPFCCLVIWASWSFVADAFVHGEHSPDPGGLPYRWLLKACIPVGFALLLLQGCANILRCAQQLRAR